jgi:hypothetical protein
MGGRLQPALLGGLFIGVLANLPVFNLCCCLWVITGGMLAAWLLQQNQPDPITAADGLLIGMMAGMAGAIIGTLISIPIEIYFGPVVREWIKRFAQGQQMPPELLEMLDQPVTMARFVAAAMFNLIVYTIFAMLGGLLGVAIFRKKTAPTPGQTQD